MKKYDLYIPSTDSSQQLHYVVWEPDDAPVAVLQLVHGMEEYIDRYDVYARALVEKGWAVIGHDHLGHGLSGCYERGFFTERKDGADVVIKDMHLITETAMNRWHLPVYIFGHSMGSFFTRRYLALYGKDVHGAIICGSGWYNSFLTGSAYLMARLFGILVGEHKKSKMLTAICTSPYSHAFSKEGKDAWLSANKENVQHYHADPLCGFGFTCGGFKVMYQNLLRVSREKDYQQLRSIPILIISGADDPVGGRKSVDAIARQYRKYGFENVTEYAISGNRHEILFEAEAHETIEYMINWLNSNR